MFNNSVQTTKKSKSQEVEVNSHNVIANGTVVNGHITIEGNVRIDGVLIGNITTKGKLVLGESGKIEGEIECNIALISGEVKGKLVVHDLMTLKSTSFIEGDVYYGKVEVDQGAKINGTFLSNNLVKDIKNKDIKQKHNATQDLLA